MDGAEYMYGTCGSWGKTLDLTLSMRCDVYMCRATMGRMT